MYTRKMSFDPFLEAFEKCPAEVRVKQDYQ
jgi:hypothetical protein